MSRKSIMIMVITSIIEMLLSKLRELNEVLLEDSAFIPKLEVFLDAIQKFIKDISDEIKK